MRRSLSRAVVASIAAAAVVVAAGAATAAGPGPAPAIDRFAWDAAGPGDVKYDFDSLAVGGGPGSRGPAIMTFGGDREASFAAPRADLVDDDVWRFSP
jgi:hypothetical protein